jgi:hypothetical protein
MRRVGTLLVLVLLLAAWLAPAALASYVSPQHACCRRGAHHCPQSSEQSFRDARLHCRTCQSLVTAHQAPKLSPLTTGIARNDEHHYIHEFSSAFSSNQTERSRSQRAPPRSER